MIDKSGWTSYPDDLIEFAWLIIAGAMNVGDPPEDPIPGWHDAAGRWRDLYHEYLKRPENAQCQCPGCV